MPTISEGRLVFTFPDGWRAEKYDETSYYRDHFQKFASSKCVDIVAFNPKGHELWLIEVKDYRCHPRSKESDIFVEVAQKVRDTLANLYLAQRKPEIDICNFAKRASRQSNIRVALHIEQVKNPSRLHRRIVSNDLINFRNTLRVADNHPWLCEMDSMPPGCQWQVTNL
jgi:hypothetical protein